MTRRFKMWATVAAVTALLSVLAAVWPDWIEVFGIEPDGGNGALEAALPLLLTLASLATTVAARREWARQLA